MYFMINTINNNGYINCAIVRYMMNSSYVMFPVSGTDENGWYEVMDVVVWMVYSCLLREHNIGYNNSDFNESFILGCIISTDRILQFFRIWSVPVDVLCCFNNFLLCNKYNI